MEPWCCHNNCVICNVSFSFLWFHLTRSPSTGLLCPPIACTTLHFSCSFLLPKRRDLFLCCEYSRLLHSDHGPLDYFSDKLLALIKKEHVLFPPLLYNDVSLCFSLLLKILIKYFLVFDYIVRKYGKTFQGYEHFWRRGTYIICVKMWDRFSKRHHGYHINVFLGLLMWNL